MRSFAFWQLTGAFVARNVFYTEKDLKVGWLVYLVICSCQAQPTHGPTNHTCASHGYYIALVRRSRVCCPLHATSGSRSARVRGRHHRPRADAATIVPRPSTFAQQAFQDVAEEAQQHSSLRAPFFLRDNSSRMLLKKHNNVPPSSMKWSTGIRQT